MMSGSRPLDLARGPLSVRMRDVRAARRCHRAHGPGAAAGLRRFAARARRALIAAAGARLTVVPPAPPDHVPLAA